MESFLAPTSRRRELIAYFILAYTISWAIEIPIALSFQGIIPIQLPMAVHYLASFGPFLAAIIVVSVAEGLPGIRRLFSGLTKWRVGRGYLLFIFVSPILLFAVAVVIARIMQGYWPDLGLLAQVDYLPPLGIPLALGLWLLTFGFAEETGWRGFALPRLQADRSALSASIILGGFWAVWHLPAFFYRNTYIAMGFLLGFSMLLFSVITASIVFTWLYNGTRGSLLMIVIFHGLFDYLAVSSAGGQASAIVMSAGIVLWGIRAYQVYGPANLSPEGKVVI